MPNMDTLIFLTEFQYLLNQFLVIDKDILPWKFTCKHSYYYIHDIHICDYMVDYNYSIVQYLNIVRLNLYLYNKTVFISDDCCGSYYTTPLVDSSLLNPNVLRNLTHLTVSFTFQKLKDSDISQLTSLKYLNLGSYCYLTKLAVLDLVNLEELRLGDNNNITSEIFPKLTKLHTLVISNRSKIELESIPDSIVSIEKNIYDRACEQCDTYHMILDHKKIK